MDLKRILKILKLNESNISMIIGAVVIVVIGMLVVNYFRGLDTGDTLPTGASIENQTTGDHTVKEGETLWDIAEEYYQDGYKWVDIRDANNLPQSGEISTGQVLTIPETPEPTLLATASATPAATVSPAPTESPEPTPAVEKEIVSPVAEQPNKISGATYTVVRGDNLWNIAVRAYGDGFKWTEIAAANKLANPNIIHAGNQLTLPR